MSDFDRFVRYLVEILQARSPESVHRPVAIDDLRRTVLPYRVHRNGLGLLSAEDYETLLLRLAAEEGGYSRTFPPEAVERCRAEVATAIPDLGLLDELAEVTIAIEPGAVSRIMAMEDEAAPFMPEAGPELPLLYEPDADPEPVAGVPAKLPVPKPAEPRRPDAAEAVTPPADPPPRAGPGQTAERPGSQAPVSRPAASVVRPAGASAAPPPEPPRQAAAAPSVTRCRFCAAALPAGRPVVFCPFCGHQLVATRCSRCDAEVEPGWRHCISCGEPIGPARSGS